MDIPDSSLGENNPLAIRNRLKNDRSIIWLSDKKPQGSGHPKAEQRGVKHLTQESSYKVLHDLTRNDSTRRSYDEIIYDISALILSSIFQFFDTVYRTSHRAYIKHKERYREVESPTLKSDEAMKKNDEFVESDSEESVIIVDVKKRNANVFDPLLRFEPEEENIDNESRQYGTTLSIARYPRFSSSRSYTPVALNGLQNSRGQLDTSSLSILESAKKTEYDSYVSKFYLPQEPVSKNRYSLVDGLIDNFFVDGIPDLFRERKERRQLISKERENLTTKLTPLSKDQLQVVNTAWKQSPGKTVTSAFQIEITTRDLQTLCDGHWLNDNVIDFYFNLITANNELVFGWTTHFYTTLKLKGYQGVARWSKRKKVNVTEKNLILVPINIMGTHWALAAINNKEKCFQYYDSLSANGNLQALHLLKNYMVEEGKKNNSSIDFDDYSIDKNMTSPQQQNGFDCGVFACICAKYVSQAKELTYGQKDMKLIRRRMAYEIITKALLD